MPKFEKLTLPNEGEIITFNQGKPNVPNNPIVPFIRGDGTGVDIWPATQIVLDSAIKKSYGDERKINWFKVYAGDEACELMEHITISLKILLRQSDTSVWLSKVL